MNDKIVKFNLSQRSNKDIPELRSGDIVKIHRKIKEGKKERIQIFEGIVIAINGKQSSSPTMTVRKVSNGVGVEIVLPIYSPNIEKIEIVKRAKVRRSKLYYIRDKSAKSLRLKYKDMAEFAKDEEEKSVEDDESVESVESDESENVDGDKDENKSEPSKDDRKEESKDIEKEGEKKGDLKKDLTKAEVSLDKKEDKKESAEEKK